MEDIRTDVVVDWTAQTNQNLNNNGKNGDAGNILRDYAGSSSVATNRPAEFYHLNNNRKYFTNSNYLYNKNKNLRRSVDNLLEVDINYNNSKFQVSGIWARWVL